MKHEFTKIKLENETRYVLETSSAGGTSTAGGATVSQALGSVHRRTKEAAKPTSTPPTVRNPVAKNASAAIGGGAAGSHKNRKKASKQVRGQKHRGQGVTEGDINEIDYADKLDSSSISIDNLIKAGKVIGNIEGNDVVMLSKGNQTIYILKVADKATAFVGFDGKNLKNIKNFTQTPGVIRALLGYLVHKKNMKIVISPNEPLTAEGLKWVIRLINDPRGLDIKNSDGGEIDPIQLKQEWKNARKTGTPGTTGITISENRTFGNKLRENELRRNSDSLLMPFNFYSVRQNVQGVAEGADGNFKSGDQVYHSGRKEIGTFLDYDDRNTTTNNNAWVDFDGEELMVSLDRLSKVQQGVAEDSLAEFKGQGYNGLPEGPKPDKNGYYHYILFYIYPPTSTGSKKVRSRQLAPESNTTEAEKFFKRALGGAKYAGHEIYSKFKQRIQDIVRPRSDDQGVAEGSEFGSYYYEKVAQEIFNRREDISSEDEVLNQAYKIVANDQGQKSARYMFNYDKDFPSDLLGAYRYLQDLQKQKQGVAEAGHQSPHAKLAQLKAKYDAALKSPNPNMTTLRRIRDQIIKLEFDLGLKEGVAEGDTLQGTPVVSLKDFNDEDTKKDKYGRIVRKKLKKDDPRVKFHKDQKQGVAEGSMPYPHGKPEAGDKIIWYYSNHYPKLEGEVVGWKDGHLIVKSIDPSPRNTEKTVVTYRVPKNNIMSVEKQGVAEGMDQNYQVGDQVLTQVGSRWIPAVITKPINAAGNYGVRFKVGAKVMNYVSSPDQLKKQGVAEGLRNPKDNPCWKGYKPVGTKKKGGRTVPNCVPKNEDIYTNELFTRLENSINEKAVSKAQQRFMGMVHAAHKGIKPASPKVARVAKGMTKKAGRDFAATKHKGLPEKKPKK